MKNMSMTAMAAALALAANAAAADTIIATKGYVDGGLATKADAANLGLLAGKNSVAAADISDGNVTKEKLASDVQASLDRADNAIQTTDLSNYATVDDLAGKADSANLGSLAMKDSVATADISNGNVTKEKLAADVQASLVKADGALQFADLTNYVVISTLEASIAGKQDSLVADGANKLLISTDAAGGVAWAAVTPDTYNP